MAAAMDRFVPSVGGCPLKVGIEDEAGLLSPERMRTVRAALVSRINDSLADGKHCGAARFIYFDDEYYIFGHGYARWRLRFPWLHFRYARIWVYVYRGHLDAESSSSE